MNYIHNGGLGRRGSSLPTHYTIIIFSVHQLCTPCNVTFSFQDGTTPLMIASKEDHVECVKLLLERGALANHQCSAVCYFYLCRDDGTERVICQWW